MIHPSRIYLLNQHPVKTGPVVYWMARDQRMQDNWALLYAQEMALEIKQPLVVVFCSSPEHVCANARQYQFLLDGLSEVSKNLERLNIPFFPLTGNPGAILNTFITEHNAGLIVTDFNPLHVYQKQLSGFLESCKIQVTEADAHNIVPCRIASSKPEFGAYTIRPKISKLLAQFLVAFPEIVRHPFTFSSIPSPILLKKRTPGADKLSKPGEKAAKEALKTFLSQALESYDERRNDPTLHGQSNLSPYLHSGQISAQHVALEVMRLHGSAPAAASFLEELIIRRELSDNFCLYNENYDRFEGFPAWAKKTLNDHRDDRRDFLYSLAAFENSGTHDVLWNSAQKEMAVTGKMHGYMRMYWAKKILEWTGSPEEAQAIAIYLNDKYSIDGNDPNGYAGIAWSIGGVHDRAWGERAIFGKVRYMNEKGCRRKFNVDAYVAKINAIAGS